MRKVVVIEGDGIGPEVVRSALRAMLATGVDLELISAEMGLASFHRSGSYLPEDTIMNLAEADACLFGAITTPPESDYTSPLIRIRREFELFANVRPVRRISPDIGLVDLDLIIFRENTEGMYTGEETWEGDSVVLKRRVSEFATRRLVRFAVETARRDERRKITCVHKANVLRRSDGLFRRVFFEELGASGLEHDEMLVDACAASLITSPHRLDCIVTLNLYGDILSDEGAALVGGLGLAPSANVGEKMALFEPVHGSAPDIAGKGVANPIAAMLSAAMMLRYLDLRNEADRLEHAVSEVVRQGNRTPDIGGNMGTEAFTQRVVERIEL